MPIGLSLRQSLSPGWHTLVVGADPVDVAIGIYRQVGFQQHDTRWMLERRAPEEQAGD